MMVCIPRSKLLPKKIIISYETYQRAEEMKILYIAENLVVPPKK